MSCREGIDPADFEGGFVDDADDPIGSLLSVLDTQAYVNALGEVWVDFTIGVNNINFDDDITVRANTTDGTASSTGSNKKYIPVVNALVTIPEGQASATVSTQIYVSPPSGGAAYTGSPTFNLVLSSPTNATILDGTGVATIPYGSLSGGHNPDSGSGLTISSNKTAGVDAGETLTFTVVLNPASGSSVSVHYATVNSTATSGSDYTAKSGDLTFAAGDTQKTVTIQTLAGASIVGAHEDFFVALSSPVGASIVTNVAIGRILPPSTPVGLPAQFMGWSDDKRVTYDEFHPGGGGGCIYKTACTGFAGAAVMSALAAKQGLGRWRFNAPKLYEDAGCPLCQSGGNCDASVCGGGCNPSRVPNWLTSTGAQRVDDNVVNAGSGANYTCTYRDITADHAMFKAKSASISANTKSGLLNQLKQAIKDNGAIYVASIFYSNWNSARAQDGYILRPHGTEHSSLGHAWCFLGWDDDYLIPANADSSFGTLRGNRVGCFRVQSSHGCDWGDNGRGYMPYDYLTLPTSFSGTAVRWKYWSLTWQG